MPTLYYSNHLENLVVSLAENSGETDPFEPIFIIVPNFNLQKWLSLELAQVKGVVANYRFLPLETAIAEAILDLDKAVQEQRPLSKEKTLLRPVQLQRLIIQTLTDVLQETQEGDDGVWSSLRVYLQHHTSPEESMEKRLFQLSARITRLFQDYSYHRPDLLQQWENGQFCFSETMAAATEKWQRQLWLELFGDTPRSSLVTLSHLITHYHPVVPAVKSKLHIFGISYISRLHQEALSKLDCQYDIFVYALNPCMEFWEDLKADWEVRREARKNILVYQKDPISMEEFEAGGLIQNEEDTPLLQAWGRPGKENIRLLNEWTGWVFTEKFVDPRQSVPPTLLEQVQYDILVREPRRREPMHKKQDESIEVMACPNVRRESEIVANQIWDLVQKDPTLKFNDIAVVVPDMGTYQADLELCFTKLHQLPYSLIDGTVDSAGRLVEGFLKLLQLGFSEYNRKDLFEIFCHPNFMARFEKDNVDVSQWLSWADELGIFYGINREKNKEDGFHYVNKDLYNWEQGFKRLTLGMYLQQEQEWNPLIYAVSGDKYMPVALHSSQHDEAVRFMAIVRSLIADTKDMPGWKMSATAWGRYLALLVKTYLGPIDASEDSIFRNILNSLSDLEALDQVCADPDKEMLSYRIVYDFVKQHHSQISIKRGFYLADGVTIASFLPMRPIPFQALFVMGLGEGVFPRLLKKDNLDLREAPVPLKSRVLGKHFRERSIGDVSNAERDKYMFLEALISTRKYLCLSYVSRNIHSDDLLEPSSILQTLLGVIESQYLPADEKFIPQSYPLKGYSLQHFPELASEAHNARGGLVNYDVHAFRQARALQLRKQLEDNLSNHFHRSVALSKERLLHQARKWQITSDVSAHSQELLTETEADELETIPLYFSQIRAFLECPLQSTARRKLGIMEEDEEDRSELIDEPFETPFLQENVLLKTVFAHAVEKKNPDWATLYEKHAEIFELQGKMPTGEFKEWNRTRHLRQLEGWQENLQQAMAPQQSWSKLVEGAQIFRFGRPLEGEKYFETQTIFSPISLEIQRLTGKSVKIELQGNTQWCIPRSECWYSIYLSNHTKQLSTRHFLRGFLDMVFLSASGQAPSASTMQSLLMPAAAGEHQRQTLKVFSQEKSQDYLCQLIGEMLDANYAFLMPIEAIMTVCKKQIPDSEENFQQMLNQEIQKLVDNPRSSFSSKWGPVQDLSSFGPPSQAYSLFQKRFSPYFETLA
ncbi:MAG: exodeoxyribonuclease V subunit gamma [SAR324 cluster bacterium]|nr:exodeoxyribonuclease V subunit gamma [SAR324 cluster bacterium]